MALPLAVLLSSGQSLARQDAAAPYDPGTLIALQGTPHLWLVQDDGSLSWIGDTTELAVLADQGLDTTSPVVVTLDVLSTFPIGDPMLSTGMLREGNSIYLVKREAGQQARLLLVPCFPPYALFGITSQYAAGTAMDAGQLQDTYGVQVDTLQRGDLDPIGAGCPRTPTSAPPARQHIYLARSDLDAIAPALQAYGLTPDGINVARTGSLVGRPTSVAMLVAPLVTAPPQTIVDLRTSTVPLGVLKSNGDITMPAGKLTTGGVYLVVVQNGRVAFIDSAAQQVASGGTLDARMFNQSLAAPQAILSALDVCFGWDLTQVCTQPSPLAALSEAERLALQTRMRAAVANLQLPLTDFNIAATVSEAEGQLAVDRRLANVIVAPANILAKYPEGAPPDGTTIGILIVDQVPLDLPNYPRIPPGTYAVRIKQNGSQADLISSPSAVAPQSNSEVLTAASLSQAQVSSISVSVKVLQVRALPASGQLEPALAIIANWCFGWVCFG